MITGTDPSLNKRFPFPRIKTIEKVNLIEKFRFLMNLGIPCRCRMCVRCYDIRKHDRNDG